jgi:hypothetical protein
LEALMRFERFALGIVMAIPIASVGWQFWYEHQKAVAEARKPHVTVYETPVPVFLDEYPETDEDGNK